MRILIVFFVSLLASLAQAGVPCTVPNTFVNNTIADANQVNANFSAVISCLLNAAQAGNNSDITSLNALTTPVTPGQGGSNLFIGGTSSGTLNAQIVTVTIPSGFTLVKGYTVAFVPGFTNSSALQINVNSTGLVNVYRQTPGGPQALTGGEAVAGQMFFASYDGTEWQMISNGPQFGGFGPGNVLTAAATTDLGTIPTHNVFIAGSTTITSFGQSAVLQFPIYLVSFINSPLITYNATSCATLGGCILTPGNASIQTAPADIALLQFTGLATNGNGNWQVLFYQRNNGAAPVSSTPNCGFNQLSWGNGASSSTVTAGWASSVLTTSAGVGLYSGAQAGLTLNITLGTATPTAGGMDGHVPGATAFVYMYAISNGSAINLIGSPSNLASGVVLPTGYTYLCYLGAIKTNNTSNLLGAKGLGRRAQYVNGGANLTALPFIGGSGSIGTACGTASPTYAAAIIQGASGGAVWVPATAVAVQIAAIGGYNGAGPSQVLLAPNNSYGGAGAGTNPPPLNISTTATIQLYDLLLESNQIFWCATNSGGALEFVGYTDAVNAN